MKNTARKMVAYTLPTDSVNYADFGTGQPESHDEAKAIFAGFAGAFIDREAETRGMDYIDREKAKRDAMNQGSDQLQQSGGW